MLCTHFQVAVVPTWAAGKQVPGVKESVLLQCVPASAAPPPGGAAQTLLQRTGALHLPFGLADLSRCCLAKSLGVLFHSSDAGRAISYLLVLL